MRSAEFECGDDMKAAYYRENGGPEKLIYGEVDDPQIGADTVLIRVEAISIEGGDLLNRQRNPPPTVPHVGGYQAAGVVEAVGGSVTRIQVGQRVAAFHWAGSHAELFAVPEHFVYPVPDGLDIGEASTIPVTFGTASDALFEFGNLQPGETVLVQGAAGGVGVAAAQLAAQAGAIVIGTASGSERVARLAEFGVTHGVDHTREDVTARCLEITGGKGVDLALDMAGGRTSEALLASLRYRGRYAIVGAASGETTSVGIFQLLRNAVTAYGVLFGREMHAPRAHALIGGLFLRAANGGLRMPIAKEFPLAEAAAAHAFVAEGHPFGRVLMRP
jgi:NADPH:quinone reductase-like Zn-dependent oxidoreductase